MNPQFYRIQRLPPYVFEEVNRLKATARKAGADIIDLGMGNPDLDAPKHVKDKLVETLGKTRIDRYSASKGIPGLRRAQAAYYKRRFGVTLNPDTQVVATLGSKEGFANVAQAITAPGDVIIVPDPSYPIHAFGFLMAGGATRSISAEPTPHFFTLMERAIRHSVPKPIAVVVCYPSNPTALVASAGFLQGPRSPSRRSTRSSSLSDLAYAELYFDDDDPPPSVLQVEGAMDCHGRVHLDVENLFHGRLAHGLRRRQRASDLRADAGKDPISTTAPTRRSRSRRRRRSTGRTTASTRCARSTRSAATSWSRVLRQGWLASCRSPQCLDVRLGAKCRRNSPTSARLELLQADDREGGSGCGPGHRLRRAGRRLCAA